jgi:hypothetical protein
VNKPNVLVGPDEMYIIDVMLEGYMPERFVIDGRDGEEFKEHLVLAKASVEKYETVVPIFFAGDLASELAAFPVDLDFNGTLDLVIGTGDGEIWLMGNSEVNGFAQSGLGRLGDIDVGENAIPVVLDFDLDFKWEALVGNAKGEIWVVDDYNGEYYAFPIRENRSNFTVPGGYSAPAVTDLNGDKIQDVLIGAGDGKIYAYLNLGSYGEPDLTFWGVLQSNGQDLDVGERAVPSAADIDKDGVLDLVIGNAAGEIWFWKGPDGPAWPCINNSAKEWGPFKVPGGNSKVNFGDMNNDGYMDVVISNANGDLAFAPATP